MYLNIVAFLFDQQIGGVRLHLDDKKNRQRRVARLLLTGRTFCSVPQPEALKASKKHRKETAKEENHLKHAFAFTKGHVSRVNGRLIFDESRKCLPLHRPDKYCCTFEKPILERTAANISYKNAIYVPSRLKSAFSSKECTCNHECSFFSAPSACQLKSKPSESIITIKGPDLFLFDPLTGRMKTRIPFKRDTNYTYKGSYYDETDDTLLLFMTNREAVHHFIIFSCNPFHEIKTVRISFLSRGQINLLSNNVISCSSSTGSNANFFDLESELRSNCAEKQQIIYLETPLTTLPRVTPTDVILGGHSKMVLLFTPKAEKKHFTLSYIYNPDESFKIARDERTIFDECFFVPKEIPSKLFYLGNHSVEMYKLNCSDDDLPGAEKLFEVATEERIEPEPRKFESNRPKRAKSFQGSYFVMVRSVFAFDYSNELDLIILYGLSRNTQGPCIQVFDGSNGQLLNTIRLGIKYSKYFTYRIIFSQLTIVLIGIDSSGYSYVYLFDLAHEKDSNGKKKKTKAATKGKNNAKSAASKNGKEGKKVKKPAKKITSVKEVTFHNFGLFDSEDDSSATEFESSDEDDTDDTIIYE